MNNNELIKLLTIVLGVMIGVLVILCLIFLILKFKGRKPKDKKEKNSDRDQVMKYLDHILDFKK